MALIINNIESYLNSVQVDRRQSLEALRTVIKQNLPVGFDEVFGYGMIGYVVPHSIYPKGYHCKPTDPLPFINITSQKNFIALYHMGMYADPTLLEWFTSAYPKHSTLKLNMGKSCIRFKKPDQIPLALIGELVSKITPHQWIEMYERVFRKG